MSRLSPPVASALALALASTLTALAGITAANATPSVPPPSAGQVIVQGVLYDADGSTADVGQTVTLTAWPTSEVLAGLADGAPVPTLLAGTALTDASGAFALRYTDPAALASYVDTDGTVDFTLDSNAGGVVHSYALSRALPAANGKQSQLVAPLDATGDNLVELRAVPGATSVSAATRGPAPAANSVPCGWLKLSTLGPRWVNIGSAYTTTGVSAAFTYVSGASSSIGVGISASGSAGTFSASGAVSVSSSATVGFPAVSGAAGRVWRTEFVFAKFGYKCGAAPYSSYKVQAVSFAGGASFTTPSATPTATFCVVQLATSHFILDKSVSTTYTASTSADIGINLKATTGYNSSTKLTFTFTTGKRLCGTNDLPGGAPGRLVAKV